MEHLTLNDFLHNSLLVQIMIAHQQLNHEENANLNIEYLWNEYRRMYYANELDQLGEACNIAITFSGTIQI